MKQFTGLREQRLRLDRCTVTATGDTAAVTCRGTLSYRPRVGDHSTRTTRGTWRFALERDGELVAGLIYNPASNEMFTAERGKGAFLNDRRMRVAARTELADCVIVTGIPLFFADRLTGGTGVAGIAAASTAGNAAAVPAIVASANPAYADAAGPATILVAACVVVTAILVPIATAWASRRFGGAADVETESEAGSPEVAAPAPPVAGR